MNATCRLAWALALALPLLLTACDATGGDAPADATLAAATSVAPAAAVESDARRSADLNRALAEARAATARYHNVSLAQGAGYQLASDCVEVPGVGAMGYHYANFGLIGATVDAGEPEILLYEPMRNGRLRLVAVEYMVAAAAWDATHPGPPDLAGEVFEDHRDPARWHGVPFAHYDLHAWIWQPNPMGLFVGLNPSVSCAFAP